MAASKLVLGSAQFGLNYGVANHRGRVDFDEVAKILDLAAQKGVNLIDTAPAYGESESVLGQLHQNRFQFVTKIPSLAAHSNQAGNDFLARQLESSLERLQVDHCHAVLFHSEEDLLSDRGDKIYQSLNSCRDQGLFNKIGVSVYSPEAAANIVSRYDIDLLQFPVNVLDQRFVQKHFLQQLKSKKIELHARSVFLQGLLTIKPKDLPKVFMELRPVFEKLHRISGGDVEALKASLIQFVLSFKEIDGLVMGCDAYQQFEELINLFLSQVKPDYKEMQAFAMDKLSIIDPRQWVLT